MEQRELQRPLGLTIIAILFVIGGIFNIYGSFLTISEIVQVLPFLSSPYYDIHEWFKFAVRGELVLSVCGLCLGFLQIAIVPGLWVGKPYSHKLTLAFTIAFVIVKISMVMLSASAPAELLAQAELNGGYELVSAVLSACISMFWLIVYWTYFNKPHVKAFLRVEDVKIVSNLGSPSSSKEQLQEIDDGFFCRYCGARNKSDAMFCMKCGKKIKS